MSQNMPEHVENVKTCSKLGKALKNQQCDGRTDGVTNRVACTRLIILANFVPARRHLFAGCSDLSQPAVHKIATNKK